MKNKLFEMPQVKSVQVGDLTLDDNRFFLIAGPRTPLPTSVTTGSPAVGLSVLLGG